MYSSPLRPLTAEEIEMDLREAVRQEKEDARQDKERAHIMACEAMREGDYDSEDETSDDSDCSEDSTEREMRKENKLIARDEARLRIRNYKYPKAEAAARKRITAEVHQEMLEQCGSDPEDQEDWSAEVDDRMYSWSSRFAEHGI